MPGLYCLWVLLGRRLKRRHRVELGWMFHLFGLALAVYVPARLLDLNWPFRREIGAIALLTSPFFINALIKRYCWEVQFAQRRETPVPKLVSDTTAITMFVIVILIVLFASCVIRAAGRFGIAAIIMLSESQERMLLVVKPGREPEVERIFDKWDLHAVRIGQVTDDGRLRVRDRGQLVADIPNRELVRQTIVNYHYPTTLHSLRISVPVDYAAPPTRVRVDGNAASSSAGSPTIASKRWCMPADHTVRTSPINLPGMGGVMRIGHQPGLAMSVDGSGRPATSTPASGDARCRRSGPERGLHRRASARCDQLPQLWQPRTARDHVAVRSGC